jgi:hypothetical protein
VPGFEGWDCERRDEGGELRVEADPEIRRAQVTDRAPVTGLPGDRTTQVSSGRVTSEHDLLSEHESS